MREIIKKQLALGLRSEDPYRLAHGGADFNEYKAAFEKGLPFVQFD